MWHKRKCFSGRAEAIQIGAGVGSAGSGATRSYGRDHHPLEPILGVSPNVQATQEDPPLPPLHEVSKLSTADKLFSRICSKFNEPSQPEISHWFLEGRDPERPRLTETKIV